MGARCKAVPSATLQGLIVDRQQTSSSTPDATAQFVPPADLPRAPRLAEGADRIAHGLIGLLRRRRLHRKRLFRLAGQCSSICSQLETLTEAQLSVVVSEARESVRRDPVEAGGRLPEVLAAVGECARRAIGMRPYTVQFMGALALQRGWLSEMATGEGKTLTAALAGVLAGWSAKPCHMVTSNDYLATRDAQEMSPLYRRCGLAVTSIVSTHRPEERRLHYGCDVVYLTAKELLADFLRDQLAVRAGVDPRRLALRHWLGLILPGPAASVQLQVRGLHTVIVDEADNVLIDEAVTPLILSAPRSDLGLAQAVRLTSNVADGLSEGLDYEVLRRQRTVLLRESARQAIADRASDLEPLWRAEPRREELLRQALTVRHFILSGHQYVIDDGKVVLLDEFTGRMTPGRTLTAGLHQAIEAREGLEVTEPNESLGQMSFQSFFRRMPRLAGTTGTGREASAEFWRIYRLGVIPIPTHRPRLTRHLKPRFFARASRKWQEVVAHVERLRAVGQPVLVGVRSVESSETLAGLLSARGVPFEMLNATRHAEEADIIARAGEAHRVTIATNMAGRGTDIRLGPEVPSLGGLHVIIAEVNESGRIDRQLAGRCGRQGDPGSVSLFVSMEDGLLERFLSKPVRLLLGSLSELPMMTTLSRGFVLLAQRRAEADAFARRRGVLKSDDWLDSALPFEPATID